MALTPVEITEGSGPPVQTDLIGGAYYQVIKLALGAEGAATLIDAGAELAAASIPVAIATDQLSTLATQATLASILTELGQKVETGDIAGLATQATLASILTAVQGALKVIGNVAVGAAASGAPVIIGVTDGTNVRMVRGNTDGRLEIVGPQANGSPVTGGLLRMAGSNGTNAYDILTDTSGRQLVDNALWIGSSAPTVGQKTMANSLPVAIASNQEYPGAPNQANAQVSVTTTATQIVGSRADRRQVMILNQGSTDMYVGGATVTTSNGLLIRAGASLVLTFTGVIQGIVASGSTTAAYFDEWD